MSVDQGTVMAELREKLKSKIDVAKFFAGFITLFIGFLLTDGKLASAQSKFGIAFLISSLELCGASVFTYDHLLTPRRYWTALSEEERKENHLQDRFQDRLYRDMVSSWWWLFFPAVVCFVIGLLLVIMQELGLPHLCVNLDVGGDLVLEILLAAAVVLPICFLIAKWPRIRA
jgi:hypothetical protein